MTDMTSATEPVDPATTADPTTDDDADACLCGVGASPDDYVRVPAEELPDCDEVDSTTVVDRRRGAGQARSQNGYSANDRNMIGSYSIPGTGARLGLRKGDCSVLLLEYCRRFNVEVQPLDGGTRDEWGYAERNIRGSSRTLSNHASGTAVDLNAMQHPLGRRGTYSRQQVDAIHNLLRFFEGTLRAGLDYSGRPDEMHVEINAGPDAVARIANKIRGGQHGAPTAVVSPPAAAPQPAVVELCEVNVSSLPMLKQGTKGQLVKNLQGLLCAANRNVKIDGDFGPGTTAALHDWQGAAGLGADGVCGPVTWRTLLGAQG